MLFLKRLCFYLLFLALNSLSAQRCGYDYLQAFVVEIVDHNHSENIPHLKLTLTNEFGQKLEYPVSDYYKNHQMDMDDRPQIPEKRLRVQFLKNHTPSNYQEFWENGNTAGLTHPGINQPAHIKLNDNLYVIFIQFKHSINQPIELPVYQVLVEDPDSIKHQKMFPKRLFRLNPEKAVYLCANDLIGNKEGVFDRYYHLDGTKFEPQKFNLSIENPTYLGKVIAPFYFDLNFQPSTPYYYDGPLKEVHLETVKVYSGQELQFMQKIVPQKFAKFAKLQTQNQDFKELKYEGFLVNTKPEMFSKLNLKIGKSKRHGFSVLLQKGRSVSGVPHQHSLYFFYDSMSKQFVFDTLLSEYPNVQFDAEPNKILRYVITDNQASSKLTYYVLEGLKWVFYKEKILGEPPLPLSSSVLNNLYLLNYISHKIKRVDVTINKIVYDTFVMINKGRNAIDLTQYTLKHNNNPWLFQFKTIQMPTVLKPRDTARIIFSFVPVPNFNPKSISMPFQYEDLELTFAFNQKEKLTLNFHYLGLCADCISKTVVSKFNRYDDLIIAETYDFKSNQDAFYQLKTENNQIHSYGKLIVENDTFKRVGDWFFTNPRNMISYSREVEFQITANQLPIDSSLKVIAVRKGIQTECNYRIKGSWVNIWLPTGIDSLIFNWREYSNVISNFSQNIYQSKYMVALIKQNVQNKFPRKYTQFVINEAYEFNPKIYLLKLKWNDFKQIEKIRQDFMETYRGIRFEVNERYSKQYLLVDFEGYSSGDAMNWLWKWLYRKEIESAHQGVYIGNGALTFLGNGVTIKPKQSIYGESLTKIVKDYGFKIYHTFGDGTYQINAQSAICGENLFLNMLDLIRDPRFILASPEFFNPMNPLEE